MPEGKLYGQDVTIVHVLEKVELCARRAVGIKYAGNILVQSLMEEFANQIQKMIKEMGDGQ